MPRRIVTIRLWEITLAFVALGVAFVVMGAFIKHDINRNHRLAVESKHLSVENQHRIRDVARVQREIQLSRYTSCKRTYSVIRRLLLASAKGRTLTAPAKRRLDELLAIVDPVQCHRQTHVRQP